MKQTKFGQKIQNWHRPLGPNELSARYQRHRNQRYSQQWENVHDCQHDYDIDHDYWHEDYDEAFVREMDETNLREFWHTQLIRNILSPLQDLRAALSQITTRDTPVDEPVPDLSGPAWIAFAQHLQSHIQRIQAYRGDDTELTATIRTAVGGSENGHIVIETAPRCAETLLLFSPFWYRSPATWDPSQGMSLMEHLFGRYPVPAFLIPERDYYTHDHDKWLCWCILLGRGGSLRAAAEVFGWDIPGRFPAFLSHVPPHLSPIQGCLYAEILRLGGNAIDCQRIMAAHSFTLDITDLSQEDADVYFWRESASWVIRFRDHINYQDSWQILAWAWHLYTEARAGRRSPFTWKGRSIRAVLEQSHAYHEEYNRLSRYRYENYNWSARGWDWKPDTGSLSGWSVVELTTTQMLVEEGQAMHHCVGGYGSLCARGTSAIVSVRYHGERRVTVEINPKNGQIIQMRGSYNRSPDRDELRVTSTWHTNVVLPALASSTTDTAEGGDLVAVQDD